MSEVTMPQLGETVTEGTITKWFKQVGDQVAEDEILFEVSTDKVDSEVPSPTSGYLTEIRVPEGETVDVGAVLAVLSDSPGAGGEAAPAEAAPAQPEAAPAEPEAPAAEAPAADAPAPAAPTAPAPAPAAAAAPTPAPASPAPAPAAAPTNGLLLSPVVRRLVAENNLDVSQITGTGPGGRITRTDVQQAIESGAARSAPAPAPAGAPPASGRAAPAAAPATSSRPAPPPLARTGERDIKVPLNNIRRRTGEHMVMSKQVSPHVLTAVEVDFEAVERVRRRYGAEWKESEGFSLTYLPFISRALIDAIAEFPHMNASVGEGELIVHDYVNLGIAVDLAFEGLLAPVVRDAESKRLRAISREIYDLANRARSKQLSPDDLAGGTFTITNPGQYGTLMQFPIINQPQVAILSTDGIRRKPVVVTDADGGESIAIHSVGIMALAWDHRAFDGAYVAAFLDRLRDNIENRDWEAEL